MAAVISQGQVSVLERSMRAFESAREGRLGFAAILRADQTRWSDRTDACNAIRPRQR
jgi:hypothetical protein